LGSNDEVVGGGRKNCCSLPSRRSSPCSRFTSEESRFVSGEAVTGVALAPDSSPCWLGSSSSGMCRLSFGRWPPVAEFVVDPGVVVVIGGGELDKGRFETI